MVGSNGAWVRDQWLRSGRNLRLRVTLTTERNEMKQPRKWRTWALVGEEQSRSLGRVYDDVAGSDRNPTNGR